MMSFKGLVMNFINRAKSVIETGFSYLGSVNASAKLKKNGKVDKQHTYGLYLAPNKLSGYNVCPNATKECVMGCLHATGHTAVEIFAGRDCIQKARIAKTRLLIEQPIYFMKWLIAEIDAKQKLAVKKGFGFSVRLNCTSDVDWANVKLEGLNIFEIFPDIQFYDYTKSVKKFDNKPANYHLTFSYTGRNWSDCQTVMSKGFNVAMVFNVQSETEIPATYEGYTVINGDLSDYRVKDGKGIIVGLKWKRIANRENEIKVLNPCFVVNPVIDIIPVSNVRKLKLVA
jgi:hypothetical protein